MFVGCLEVVWRVSRRCLKGFWRVSDWCLLGIKRVSGGHKEGVWKMSKMLAFIIISYHLIPFVNIYQLF